MSDRLLSVHEIDAYYGPVQALRGVTLHVDEGEMVALVGANGAGKTTTLRAITGLLSPRRGSIAFAGKPIHGMPAHQVVRLGISHLPEGRDLFPTLTVLENLRMGHWPRRRDRAAYDRRLEHAFELFPRLRERSGQPAGTMSGGEQQMLGVARALMSNPRLFVVDELSLGLAPMVVAQLFEVLKEVNRDGTSVLLVEQFVHMALRNSSRAYVLAKGQVVAGGISRELLADSTLVETYLGGAADSARGTSEPRRPVHAG